MIYDPLYCKSLTGNWENILFDVPVNNGGLYVSFKDDNGNWREAGDCTLHGFKPGAGGAHISPNGKYLFFNHEKDLWWVWAQVIEELRPK